MKMKYTFLVLSFLTSISAFANEGDTLKVCGVVYESPNGVKGIADKNVMTSYELVIDEVAKPTGLNLKLINYQSDVFRSLKGGKYVCAIGIQGSYQDTRYPTINLTQWAIISE
jgi:hypothetical protein